MAKPQDEALPINEHDVSEMSAKSSAKRIHQHLFDNPIIELSEEDPDPELSSAVAQEAARVKAYVSSSGPALAQGCCWSPRLWYEYLFKSRPLTSIDLSKTKVLY